MLHVHTTAACWPTCEIISRDFLYLYVFLFWPKDQIRWQILTYNDSEDVESSLVCTLG